MQLLGFILLVLVVWWIAFAICVASDKARQTRAQKIPPTQPAVPHDVPRWPTWSEFRTRPNLFLIIPWCALLYGVVLVFIWPAIPIHKLWLWSLRKKSEDHAA
jgi:hypothetical protein